MFTADTPSHTHSTRSKRTRQAAGNDDSLKLPLTKKRRSALRRDTFEPLTDASINERAGREKPVEKVNGHVEPKLVRTTSQVKELTLRGLKKTDKRTEKGGGQLILSNNDFYTVAQLPSLPDQIRSHPTMPISCVVSPEYDYVLALTHTDALIWPYNSSASVPSPRDLISFKLPFPPASVEDPLPLASFTAKSANGEPGIVAVSPKWGKIVYWESITSASSFVPGQTSSGVQASVPGMLNGETIKELVKAEPAGFAITFSHGRVAHLTVRDQMGRPGIGIQFLRKSVAGSAKGGIFGSIRNVFAGDRRKGTPIVRAGKSSKAQRDVVVGTEDGEFELWNTNLSVGNSLMKTVSVKDNLLATLQVLDPDLQAGQLRILDFELATTPSSSHEIAKRGDVDAIPLVLLVAVAGPTTPDYFLVEAVALEEMVHVKELHQVRYSPENESFSWRPRLSISKSQPLAFVLFERAVVLISLARIKETPSSQLLMEKAGLPDRFQDCIRFQDGSIYKVLAYSIEDEESRAACVFAVQGFGIVRITSKLQTDEEVDVEEVETSISPKSKIEQAIFFGTIRQNPLELKKPVGNNYTSEEIEAAVLDISKEIISSTSKYLPKSAPSIDNHMKLRAKALEDLADHVMKYYSNKISRKTRFQLLLNAEKLAAAQAIWKVQENIQRSYPRKDDREMTYLNFVLRALHETRQKYPDFQKGEQDHVRHWLINSVGRIEHLVVELTSSLEELDDMDVKDPRIVCDYLIEAVDLWIAAYQTAFRFREDHAPVYGLGDEVFDDGVLQVGYPAGLPNPWTSEGEAFKAAQQLIYFNCNFLDQWWDYNLDINTKLKGKKGKEMPTNLEGKPYDVPSKDDMLDLAARLPTEVELFSRITTEENIQAQANVKLMVQDSDQQQKQIGELKREIRPRLVKAITAISTFNAPGAIELAEKLQDPGLLVALNTDYLRDLEKEAHLHPEERPLIEQKIEEVQDHVETYFDTLGNPWAFAHFSDMVEQGSLGSLLAEVQASKGQKQKFLTWFLKKSDRLGQQVGKISWINDVIGEARYDRAQRTLEKVAYVEETDIWAKKTELCLAKLAGLAANEGVDHPQKETDTLTKYDKSLSILTIQESIMVHVSASISDAIDEKAANDLAISTFARLVIEKTPALKSLLIDSIQSVVANQALDVVSLVNLLTLMDPVEYAGMPDEDPAVLGREFSTALQAIDLSSTQSVVSGLSLSSTDFDALRMMTWRRSMIRDDWSILNDTSGKSDTEVEHEMQHSAVYKTLVQVFERYYDVDNPSPDQPFTAPKLFSPQQILEQKTLFPESLGKYLHSSKIPDHKKLFVSLQKELSAEQERLRKFVEKAQLNRHWEGMVKEAERSYKENLDKSIEAEANGQVLENGSLVESVEVDEA